MVAPISPPVSDLQGGLDLATVAGRDDRPPDQQQAQQRDAELPGDDHYGDPPGQLSQQGEADQRGAGQRLVGDRIGDLPEVGDQVVSPGQLAVQMVGDRGHHEHAEGRETPAGARDEEAEDEEGDERQSDHREDVGDVPQTDHAALVRAHGPALIRAIRSTPSASTTMARTIWPGTSPIPCTVTEPSTSGPWWAALPS